MLDPVGFWSYARLDDEHSDGQLSQLRAVVGKQIGMQHGDRIALWQDIQAIPYGADWAAKIEDAIGKTTFFIPIVTPRFLKSVNCRDECLAYRRRMRTLARDDLIFPVHYVNIDDLRPEDAVFGDDLAALRRAQWIDFRPLFYGDPKSAEVRRWAGEFAGGILQAMRRQAPGRNGAGAMDCARAGWCRTRDHGRRHFRAEQRAGRCAFAADALAVCESIAHKLRVRAEIHRNDQDVGPRALHAQRAGADVLKVDGQRQGRAGKWRRARFAGRRTRAPSRRRD